MEPINEIDELAARIARLPADVQQALAWRVLRRFGYETPEEAAAARAEWEAQARAELDALLAWEKANGLRSGEYRTTV